MTITTGSRTEPDQVLAATHSLHDELVHRADEVENARRLPEDLLATLLDAGCFSVLLPRSHGGAEADLTDALSMFEALARADASVGWTVMIGGGAWRDISSLPRASFDALYEERGADTIVAGAFSPSGQIAPADGGYELTGRWGFASGANHAAWFFANALEGFGDEGPMLRVSVLAPDEVTIEDTWDSVGLRGTGSHHFQVEKVIVDADRTHDPLRGEPCLDTPIVRVHTPAFFALSIAAVATGNARGAIDDVTALAEGKVPLFSDATLSKEPHFHVELGRADASLRAARSLLEEEAGRAWDAAVEGRELDDRERAEIRASAVWATEQARRVADVAYHAGGGSSVYVSSPLQRRMRDAHTITQHFLVKGSTMLVAGGALVGQEIRTPIF